MKHGGWRTWEELAKYLRLQLDYVRSKRGPRGDWEKLHSESLAEVAEAVCHFCNTGTWPAMTPKARYFIRQRIRLAHQVAELFAKFQGGLSKKPIPVPAGDVHGGDTAGVLAVLLLNVWSSLAPKRPAEPIVLI